MAERKLKNLKNFIPFTLIICALLVGGVFTLFLGSCETPMGLGKPIDFTPPEITLDTMPNPLYAKYGCVFGGTVKDDVAVAEVVMFNAVPNANGEKERLFTAKLLPNNRFEFSLNFGKEQNNEKLTVEIVAFDKMGNASSVNLTIIVDLRPPIVEQVWIERKPGNVYYLETEKELKDREKPDNAAYDKSAEKRENMHKFQNGVFTFKGKLFEDETRIEKVVLEISDVNKINTPLYSKTIDKTDGISLYAPEWVVNERDILSKGDEVFGSSYTANYYAGTRYYYYVSIIAYDRSDNNGSFSDTLAAHTEQQGYFAMWEKADIPKGIVDPIIGNTVYKKMPIPVQVFDDDGLEKAFVGMLSIAQWNGEQNIDNTGSGVKIPANGKSSQEIADWLLKYMLEDNKKVYNWQLDPKYPHYSTADEIKDIINGKNVDDVLHNISTGTNDNDYGNFVIFTIVTDKKQPPHPTTGNVDTLKSRSVARYYPINIIDDNFPLVVFDTVDIKDPEYLSGGNMYQQHLGGPANETDPDAQTGGSPEENTFPRLDTTDGKTFTINGYTLRENNSGNNKVERFRMAWIPYEMIDNPTSENQVIAQTERFLRWYKDPKEPARQTLSENQPPPGIQYWILDDKTYANSTSIHGSGTYSPDGGIGLIKGQDQTLGTTNTTKYIKQVFRKKFNILGDTPDDLKAQYYNFKRPSDSTLENKTKVFVFCAIDNMDKVVYRTIRLLPQNTPPTLNIYDITAKTFNNSNSLPTGIPNPFDFASNGDVTNSAYVSARNTYNTSAYAALKGASGNLTDDDRTIPLQSYPRQTALKYWVTAEKSGDIAIASIKMEDVTNESPVLVGSSFNITDRALSYIELFPEVTTRNFKFTATDLLGNTAVIQRTISITSGAMLTNIEADRESGTYGIGKVIKLYANFDGLIGIGQLNQSTGQVTQITPPGSGATQQQITDFNNQLATIKLVIGKRNTADTAYISYEELPCIKLENLRLEFEYTVKENDDFILHTAYNLNNFHGGTSYDRPIKYGSNIRVIDDTRKDIAFTPVNEPSYDWPNNNNTVQKDKTIKPYGIRPEINAITVSGKDPQNITVGGTTYKDYYFKSGETIEITLTGNKDIRKVGNPELSFRLSNVSGDSVIPGNTVKFEFVRPSGANGLVFSLPVDNLTVTNATSPNTLTAELDQIGLSTATTTIIDDYENQIVATSINANRLGQLLGTQNIRIYIDRRNPAQPASQLSKDNPNNFVNMPNGRTNYNFTPELRIPDLSISDTAEPWPVERQYSLNGGNTWQAFNGTTAVYIQNGTHIIQTRYRDRAGNLSAVTEQEIVVRANFPRLIAINAFQPNGTYNSQNELEFLLNFDDVVYTRTGQTGNVTITVADTTNSTNATYGGTSPTYSMQLTATAIPETSPSQTVSFLWPNASFNGKDMLNGLRVTNINISGLTDSFGTPGPTTAITNITVSDVTMPQNDPVGTTYTTAYDISKIIVNTIIPVVRSREPQSVISHDGTTRSGNITGWSNDPDAIPATVAGTRPSIANGSISSDNRTIRLNFGKPMQRGNGTIIIKPRGNFAIPAVFENDGYYLNVSTTDGTETRSNDAVDGYTYIMGFADIFNNATDADKQVLIGSTDMSKPSLSLQTGLSNGRYLRMTHGLTPGLGLSGNYGNVAGGDAFNTTFGGSPFLVGIDAPGPHIANAMIPDLSLKWVLRYNITDIHNATAGGDVAQIRAVLNSESVKWRWQEILASSGNITFKNGGTVVTTAGTTVEIKLPEPLLPGLQWDVYYTAGTFTDTAGNPVAAAGYTGTTMDATSSYWFWSRGVQTPVVRVDRKSYDARQNVDLSGSWNKGGTNPGRYSDTSAHNGTIASFNTVNYRIESETPGALILYNTHTGANNTGSATGSFTGNVNGTAFTTNNIPADNNIAWSPTNKTANKTTGRWMRPNLIYRNRNTSNASATPSTTNGHYSLLVSSTVKIPKYVNLIDNGTDYYGFRSYNRDATLTDLGTTLTFTGGGATTPVSSTFTYTDYQASKNYVAAIARIAHGTGTITYPYQSNRGYEGVFRTVLMMNQSNITGSDSQPFFLGGVTAINGIPTTPAFPLKDGVATVDSRFVKAFYRLTSAGDTNKYYWVSTEMVSEWYMQNYGRGDGGSYGNMGDWADWLTCGYGDLSYVFQMTCWGK